MKSLPLPSIHGEFTLFLQIHYEIDYKFIIYFAIWLYTFFSQIYYELTIICAIKLCINYQFPDLNLLSFSRDNNKFTIFRDSTLNSLFFRKFIMNLLSVRRIYYLFRELILNLVTFSRIHYKITIYFANLFRFTVKLTMNSLSISRFDFEITFFEFTFFWIHFLLHYEFFLFRDLIHYQFPNCLWVHYLFRELTMNWISFSIHYWLTI